MLAGKVAVITGTSSGLGRAIALKFASQGASIICADRNPTSPSQKEATHDVLQKRGNKSIFVPTDVSDESSIQKLVQEVAREYGQLDMYVLLYLP